MKAGLENCTCVSDKESENTEDYISFVKILKYVQDQTECPRQFKTFINYLETYKSFNVIIFQEANKKLPRDIDQYRKGLEIYLHAVHILGTTLGQVFNGAKNAR